MELRGATIAVTGATGFLGRYIVDVLLARRARVVGVVRNPARVPSLAGRPGVELRAADLADRAALARGFAGADALVSNAALLPLKSARWDEFQRTNVAGTRNVFEAAADASIRRVVQVSSVSVYAGRGRAVGEDAPQLNDESRRTFTNAYAVSKAVSEQLAWKLAAEHDLALTCIRPGAIYGAFDTGFTAVFRWLAGWPVTVMPAWLQLPLVYAGDVAEAIALALERPVAIGRAYNVTGDDLSLWEFARAWREAGGRTASIMLPLPVPFVTGYDHRRARDELGWRNRPFVDALHETLALEARG
jgi:nucleoside-diphosphate-sugar epimerase